MFGKFYSARFHLDEATAGPDEVGEFCAIVGKTDAIFEGATFLKGVRIVAEGREKVKKKGLSFALFVAFEFGGELSELVKSPFL